MGCFNVSCGISKLTINYGERAFLLPLEVKDSNELSPTTMFLYPTDCYVPFCFPIEGIYNDYGSLEDIVHNENTKILEDFFGLTIEQIVSLLTEGRRDIYDTYSSFNEIFFKNNDILEDKYSFESFLEELDFKKSTEHGRAIYSYKNTNIVIAEEKNEWTINYREEEEGLREIEYELLPNGRFYSLRKDSRLESLKKDFLKLFQITTGITLGIKNSKTYNIISKLSGMFIHGEVYDMMVKEPLDGPDDLNFKKCDEFFLQYFGFKKNKELSKSSNSVYEKNGIKVELKSGDLFFEGNTKKSYYYVEDFQKQWKKKSKEVLQIEDILTDDYKWKSIMYNIEEQKKRSMLFYGDDYLNFLDLKYIEGFVGFRDYKTFIELYKNAFINGNLKKEYFDFKNFRTNVYVTNTLLFPTFQEIQGGDLSIEKKFYSQINEIVKNKCKRYDEEYGEDEDE